MHEPVNMFYVDENEITKNNPIMFEEIKEGDYKLIELLTKLEKVIRRTGQKIT